LITPISFALYSVNQSVPFGPAASPSIPGLSDEKRGISVIFPVLGLMKPN
jgi:hypothetical protein